MDWTTESIRNRGRHRRKAVEGRATNPGTYQTVLDRAALADSRVGGDERTFVHASRRRDETISGVGRKRTTQLLRFDCDIDGEREHLEVRRRRGPSQPERPRSEILVHRDAPVG